MSDGPISIGVRRVPDLDLGAPFPDSDPRLVSRITAEIRNRGPMTFARFMELALYDPEAGYYATTGQDATTGPDATAERDTPGDPHGAGDREAPGRGPGRSGDFLTAPEGHPIFGWVIARQLEEVWERLDRPRPFVVREHGAGLGGLAHGILDGLRRSGSPLLEAIRYQPVEVSAGHAKRIRDRLGRAGLDGYLEAADDRPMTGAVLANELLDALPVHRVEGAPADDPRGPLLERFVDVGAGPSGALTTVLQAPSTPRLAARLAGEGVALEPGQPAEICLAIESWLATAAAPLERGLVLLIDYGADARDLYAPGRGSTLRAYHRHRVHDDPLVAIGRQDMTAHVDLTAVEGAARGQRLDPLGRTAQAAFLGSLGLGELLVGLQADPATTLEGYLVARSAVARMLDPRATGGFQVLAFGRGLATDPPLRGFAGTPPAGPAALGAPPDPNR